jgi:hypothetical protein
LVQADFEHDLKALGESLDGVIATHRAKWSFFLFVVSFALTVPLVVASCVEKYLPCCKWIVRVMRAGSGQGGNPVGGGGQGGNGQGGSAQRRNPLNGDGSALTAIPVEQYGDRQAGTGHSPARPDEFLPFTSGTGP